MGNMFSSTSPMSVPDNLTITLTTPHTTATPEVPVTVDPLFITWPIEDPRSTSNTASLSLSTTQSHLMEPLRINLEEPTFTNFSKLAIELRLLIWQHALPEPRLIIVGPTDTGVSVGFTPGLSAHFASGQKTVALAHVNREARTETLRHYRLSFKHQFHGNAIYFDFSRDTLLMLCSYTFTYFFDGADGIRRFHDEPRYCFEKLRHFVVADRIWRIRPLLIERFCKLEDYTALCGDTRVMYPASAGSWTRDLAQELRDSWSCVARERGQSDFMLPRIEESPMGIERFTQTFWAKHAAYRAGEV